jgi:hypothetical protein
MKEKKTYQLRVRLTESQFRKLLDNLVENETKYKNKSTFVRDSINEKISRNNRHKSGKPDKNEKSTSKR